MDTLRGKRSKILLVPDSKEYYKGIKIIQWYWLNTIEYIKINYKEMFCNVNKNNKINKKLEKINKKYWDSIEKAKQKRDKDLSKYTSCLVYCDCDNELTSSKSFISDEGEQGNNVVTYKCSHCGQESKWNFDLAPVPLKYDVDIN